MKNNIFETLDRVDVSTHTEKKGQFNYLSWAWAVRELLRVAPEATWIVHEGGLEGSKQPYMQTGAGCFVKVSVNVNGISREQVHPVLDNRNQPIKTPNAFQINTSIQRCLAKAIALHGLGLYIFAGEDLPDSKLDESLIKRITNLAEKTKDTDVMQKIDEGISSGKINKTNITSYEARILDLIKERENSDSNE